ncbi:MAG: hypothetical protein ACXWKR_17705 [Phenylobacterium sp.]
MPQLLKAVPLLATLVAVAAFAAPPDPHHADAQPSAATAEPASPAAKADADHGCPMAGGHMMAGHGHMSGASGQHVGGGQMMGGVHCQTGQGPAKSARRHARHPHHHTGQNPSK